MPDGQHEYQDLGLSRTRLICLLLNWAAFLWMGAAAVWSFHRLWSVSQSDQPTGGELISTIALLLAALAAGMLLIGISELIRRFESIELFLESDDAGLRADARHDSESAQAAVQRLDHLARLTRELRDISLLSEPERRLRLDTQAAAALGRLSHEVPTLLREHNWVEARHRVQDARERFPSLPNWDEMEAQIEQMRVQVESRDIEAAERQIQDLTALAAWDRVGEVVAEMLHRHPDSPRANEIARQVREQRDQAESEQRSKLLGQAKEASHQRDWTLALNLANELIRRFPKSPEAQALKLDLPMLRENAEIKTRQRIETQIRDLLKDHRYTDALRMTRELIDQYPNSPQAEVLREQLPRMERAAVSVSR